MPSAFTGDTFGYNKARRDWARQLNIDPYTTNPVLRPPLDNAAAASFAGSFAINTAIGAVSMGANLVVGFDTDVRDAVWNLPAVDLARQNESQLLAMGASGRTTRNAPLIAPSCVGSRPAAVPVHNIAIMLIIVAGA